MITIHAVVLAGRYCKLKVAGDDVAAVQFSVAPLELVLLAVKPDGVGQDVGQALVVKGTNADHVL